jgi:hypothetical protein
MLPYLPLSDVVYAGASAGTSYRTPPESLIHAESVRETVIVLTFFRAGRSEPFRTHLSEAFPQAENARRHNAAYCFDNTLGSADRVGRPVGRTDASSITTTFSDAVPRS